MSATAELVPLTARQQEVLDFISVHITQWGYPPTIREIGDGLQIRSTNGVNDHLKALERKGWITRDSDKSRSYRPVADEALEGDPHQTIDALTRLCAAQQGEIARLTAEVAQLRELLAKGVA